MSDSSQLLSADGPFGAVLEGFEVCDCQLEMAAAVEQAIADGETLIAESGTGTGKTFAYLVPALLSGKKVLVSTGTRNLQDQLYHRDLPLVRKALGVPVTTALLKGRANYLCLHRLTLAQEDARRRGAGANPELAQIADWATHTQRGDIAELASVPESSSLWPRVTSTSDNCLGTRCEQYEACHVNRVRREALRADLLVVNHHLFFADLALREEGFGQLLPGTDAVIFDEAHRLPETATQYLGTAVGGHQIHSLCRDARVENAREKSAIGGFDKIVDRAAHANADFRLAFTGQARRAPWEELENNRATNQALAALSEALDGLCGLLESAAARGEGLKACARRAMNLQDALETLRDQTGADHVRWIELTRRSFVLRSTPLDTAPAFRAQREAEQRAWIFTSATLAVNRDFRHFQRRLGLDEALAHIWDSPFDYKQNALLYLPEGLPEPGHPSHTAAVVEAARPVLAASGGRAFMLFTSHRALRAAADLLAGAGYELFVQGDAPRAELIEAFRSAHNAVLLGTASFWEGVDVRGDALSCVIIDKLPFEPPNDPVLRARGAALEATGGNPFMEHQLPNAVIALKQGVGRLIRDARDRGVLMLCDPRLRTRGYGKAFLNSLPPMPVTGTLAEVEDFFSVAPSPAVARS